MTVAGERMNGICSKRSCVMVFGMFLAFVACGTLAQSQDLDCYGKCWQAVVQMGYDICDEYDIECSEEALAVFLSCVAECSSQGEIADPTFTMEDAYEPDDTLYVNSDIKTDGSHQTHDFYPRGDVDLVSFVAEKGATYIIETTNLQEDCDTVIQLLDWNGEVLEEDDDSGDDTASLIEWAASTDGMFFVRIRHYNNSAQGAGTGYDISVFKMKQMLIMGTTDRVTQLSFANSYDHYSWHVLRATTDALMKLDPDTLELKGGIAESWDVSADGMEYTFHIRPGITFWDGAACDAAAVKWSLDRTLRLDGPEGAVGLIKVIDYIDVIDDLTVKITLTMADAIFLLRMEESMAPALIYSPKTTPENDFANGVYAGTGPYKLVEYVPDQYVKYEAYDGYYGKAPKTKDVIEKMYSDAAALRAALEAGDVDFIFRTLSPQDIKDLEDNPNVDINFYPPSPGVRYLLFNVTQPPVDNPIVRQAITYAVDREAIISQVFSGTVDPIYTMVPMVDPPFFGAIDVFPGRDLDIARVLLKKAGYSETNKLELNLWYTPKHYGTTEGDVATVVAGSLEETGMIDISIQMLEWGAYTERMSSGGFDMFFLGWHPDYLESSNFLAPWTTESPEGLGTFFNYHPNYDAYKAIMDVAIATADTTKRSKLYKAIQILSVHDVPFIPLWGTTDEMVIASLPNVHGATLNVTMDIQLWNIYKD